VLPAIGLQSKLRPANVTKHVNKSPYVQQRTLLSSSSGLICQVGSNKSKIQIRYKIQNKQTKIKKTEHANIPIKLSKLKKMY